MPEFTPDPDDALLVEVATRVFGAAYYGGRMPKGGLVFKPPLVIGGESVERVAYRSGVWLALVEAWIAPAWIPNEILLAAIEHRLSVVGTFSADGATWEVEFTDPLAAGIERFRVIEQGTYARALCKAVVRVLKAVASE